MPVALLSLLLETLGPSSKPLDLEYGLLLWPN